MRSVLLLLPLAAAFGAPCCSICGGDTVKYWALDTPNNECAETCLNPSDKLRVAEFGILTGFKGKQAGNDAHPCATNKFHTFNRTDNIGAGPIKIQLDKYLPDGAGKMSAMSGSDFVVADMHDGDMKRVTFGEFKTYDTIPMTIRPSGNNQSWTVEVTMHVSQDKVE